jgi:hypothetical protein
MRQRLAADVESTRLLMVATITDARRLGANVPAMVVVSVAVWLHWTEEIQGWADQDD